ncbi:Tol-Pal system beta propeller repeat protein TolB [Methylovirgula ligni]|uniref:Tol-Pal system protein TolB n=1 Tax=Methylovirgula ligni TaxID=569860 RepID=A0A3D9YQ57_9HYPH|nr:Tol-Pal system beta propeller repeat protein TolB [Methylovirgula ligni]QAY94820.1 Tol-Pal system beta propeller repeat protein TolB [Methylovirgula ligni]REF84756.1 TolB protein [Methylovirgula ligni]
MPLILTRRTASGLLAGVASSLLLPRSSFAQDQYFNVKPGSNFKPVNVAVTQFAGDAGPNIASIISNNFSRSVFLAPVDPGRFPQQISNPDQAPQFDGWKAIDTQFVVTGRSGAGDGGRLQTEFRLWDVNSGAQVAGQQYVTDPNNSRRVAHIISDAIFSRITGEKGFFDTRVAFVDETGPAENRRKRLAIMDQDGANVRYLTGGQDLVVTPRFSPSSQQITYMAFGAGDPKVLLLNIETGQRQVVGNFPGMEFSPRFSPNGQNVVLSLEENGVTNIYEMNIASHASTRLSNSSSIDTAPSFSPDGSQIVFESDRGGSQQIYVMPASGGDAQRISFGEGSYSTPVWSPKGDYIAFTKQKTSTFAIGVMKPDGSGERILTEGFHNEGPTWAPNGLFLMFFRDPGGESGPHIFMIDVFGRAEFKVPTPSYASDPAWGPLLG